MQHKYLKQLFFRGGMAIYLIAIYLFYFRDHSAIEYLFVDSFLAYIPIELSFHLVKERKTIIYYVLFFLYVLFLPNNAYLLTDLIHFNRIPFYQQHQVVMSLNSQDWLMFAISLFGILTLVFLGYQTLNRILNDLQKWHSFSDVYKEGITLLILFLSSIGVYVGRFLRFNSVDLFARPLRVIDETLHSINADTYFFIMIFTILQYGLYQLFNRNMVK